MHYREIKIRWILVLKTRIATPLITGVEVCNGAQVKIPGQVCIVIRECIYRKCTVSIENAGDYS